MRGEGREKRKGRRREKEREWEGGREGGRERTLSAENYRRGEKEDGDNASAKGRTGEFAAQRARVSPHVFRIS